MVALLASALVLAGCASSASPAASPSITASPSASPTVAATAKALPTGHYVALGDSVPAGTNCDCTPYPELTAAQAQQESTTGVSVANDSVPGYTSTNLLKELQSDQAVIDNVTRASVVEVEIGANDVAYNSTCGTTVSCYESKLPTVQSNLDAIVKRIHQLASPSVTVVLIDYWSVWLGGQYAAAKGQAYVDAAAAMTDRVNTLIKDTAARDGSHYVDLRTAFKGPDYSYDETHYLSSDGDHPNAEGHVRIAEAVVQELLG